MFDKINAIEIIQEHFHTLKSNKTGKISASDIFLFFIIPLFISLLLTHLNILLDKDIVNTMATSSSLFAGLLLNLLLLVFDLTDKIGDDEPKIQEALKQLYLNISFSILVSILIILFLLAFFLNPSSNLYIKILSFLTYYLLFVFILTLLMVLKRIYKMLSRKFNNQ